MRAEKEEMVCKEVDAFERMGDCSITTPFSGGCPRAQAIVPFSGGCPFPATTPFSGPCPGPHDITPFSGGCPFPSMASFSGNRPHGLEAPFSGGCPDAVETVPRERGYGDAKMCHVFSKHEIRAAAEQQDCHAILAHGVITGVEGFDACQIATEHAPIFVSRHNPLRNISLKHVRSILQGDEREWRDLGLSSGLPIHIYLNGAFLQRQKFLVLIERMGLSPERLSGIGPVYGRSYDELENLASADPGAIVLGLKAPRGSSLRVLTVDGESPCNSEGWSYTIDFPLYYMQRPTVEGEYFRQLIFNRLAASRASFQAAMATNGHS